MPSPRTRVSDCLALLVYNLKRDVQTYKTQDSNQVSLEVLATEARIFLQGPIVRQARRVYEEGTYPIEFWAKDKTLVRLISLLEDYGDYGVGVDQMEQVISTLERFITKAKSKERKWEKHETYAYYALPWRGFKVVLKDISKHKAEQMLGFIYEMLKVFEEKDFDQIIYQRVSQIRLMHPPTKSTFEKAYYHGDKRRIDLYDTLLTMGELNMGHDFKRNPTMYALVHEIGHWVHLDYLPKDVKEWWDKPWEGIDTSDPNYNPYHHRQLESLRVPTEYGLTNVKEDFAETFAWYFLDPSSLHPDARARMKTALTMARDRGRSLMRHARSIYSPLYPDYFTR